jgi:heme ABC exporter ATP-binding subunit CcmA
MTAAPLAEVANAVELRSVVCLRDGLPVLAGVDLDVARGEALLVTGDNGTGKSTLLRVIAGLLPFRSGSARVLGQPLPAARGPVRGAVALVGHQSLCYDDLSVRDNLRFHARGVGADPRSADEWLDRVGLVHVAERLHVRLSAGQLKRCSVAVAMLRAAPVLLLDEPFASLDGDGRAVIDGVLTHARATGTSVILVSHERQHAKNVTDREVVLDGGRLFPGDI